MTPTPYVYQATVSSVHDGDTITVALRLGFDVTLGPMSLRLNGINAPELNTPAGKAARDWLAAKIPPATPVVIATVKDRQEKYGRYLADIYLGEEHLNTALIAAGHAVAWDGRGTRPV